MRRFVTLFITILSVTLMGCAREGRALTLATTTSVANSGLLDRLVPAFLEEHGYRIQTHIVGSGRALVMLAEGHADVVISHAPRAEAEALAEHPDWAYRKIMFNDFVLAGPAADPARVKGAPDVHEAMRRIARTDVRFISRGDRSGTHEREQSLWHAAGERPAGDRIVVAGSGMGTALRVASESGAYILTDRATFAQQARALTLEILFDGPPPLLNTYAVIVNRSSPHSAGGMAFAEWLASGTGRRLIAEYRVSGDIVAFTPWPADRTSTVPGDLPR